MGITTLERVKLFLDPTGSTSLNEGLITMLIETVGNDIEEYRRRPFKKDESGNTVYPPGTEMIALQLIALRYKQGKTLQEARKSRTLDDFTESFAMPQELQEAETAILSRLRRYAVIV